MPSRDSLRQTQTSIGKRPCVASPKSPTAKVSDTESANSTKRPRVESVATAIQDDHDLQADIKPEACLNVPFIQMDDVYKMLTQPTGVLSKVPRGLKSNHRFVVNNSSNVDRMDAGLRRNFWDDCGVWRSGGPVCKR